MRAFGLSLLFIVAVSLIGCKAGGEGAVIGKWKGQVKMGEAQKDDPAAKMAEAFASMMSMDMELKADHKYTLTVMIISMEGDWSMSGNTVTLTPKTVMGMSVEDYKKQEEAKGTAMSKSQDAGKPMQLELQSDGKTMKGIDPAAAASKGAELVFTKS